LRRSFAERRKQVGVCIQKATNRTALDKSMTLFAGLGVRWNSAGLLKI